MKKKILIIIALLCSIGGAYYVYTIEKYTPRVYVKETPQGPVTVNTNTGVTTQGTKAFTFKDIATHNNATSCYTAISGNVYDLTAWVAIHQGGSAPILSMCGNDGTEKFMKKHKGAAKYMSILARFKIGMLQN